MSNLKPAVSDRDHITNGHGKVTLVEYGDYECPYCGDAHQIIKKLQAELGEELRFVFRNYPLVDMHPQAVLAAEAAEAAAAQGKFWEMHDALYDNQDALELEDIFGYARHLDLDMDKFRADLETHRLEPRIIADLQSGDRSDVEGTPSFFINGMMYDESWNYDSLLEALRQELSVPLERKAG